MICFFTWKTRYKSYVLIPHRDGRLQIGDELLWINGRHLIGLTHQEGLELLHGTSSVVQLVLAREVVKAFLNLWNIVCFRNRTKTQGEGGYVVCDLLGGVPRMLIQIILQYFCKYFTIWKTPPIVLMHSWRVAASIYVLKEGTQYVFWEARIYIFLLGKRESAHFLERDSGIGNRFREAGFTRIVSISASASFYVPRFWMISVFSKLLGR